MILKTVFVVCYILKLGEFIVHARFGKFLDASADFAAQTQESNAGERTRNCANRDHIPWSVQLKLGEFSRSYLLYMFSTPIQSVCGCLG